jgi:hypothetical protein
MPSTADESVLEFSLPTRSLTTVAEPLSNRLGLAALAAVLPILLTSTLIGAYAVGVGLGGEPPRAVVDTAYGLSALGVFGGVYLALGEHERDAAIRFERPSSAELLWTAVCLPLAVGAFLLGSTVAELLGFPSPGFDYSLADPATLAAVVFGGIVVAPFVEEVLFRGLLVGSLLGRGLSPLVAGLLSVLVFAGVHVVALGVAGVFAIAAWAVFPTLLRLRFNNLTGAWLLHAVNNVYSYVVLVALGVA